PLSKRLISSATKLSATLSNTGPSASPRSRIDLPPRPAYSGAPFYFRGKPFSRPRLSPRRKPHRRPQRIARRPHNRHDHGLRCRRQPSHPLGGGHSRRRRFLCHLHFFRVRPAYHGTVR